MVAGRPSVRYQALTTLLACLMTSLILTSLAGFWRLETTGGQILQFAAIAAAFGWLVWRFPWVALGALIAGVLGGAVGLKYQESWVSYLLLLQSQASDLFMKLRSFQFETTFGPDLGNLFLLLIAVGAGLLITQESLQNGRAFWSIICGVVIFGIEWAWYYDRSEGHFMGYLVLAFTLWVVSQAAHRDARWESSGRKIGYRSHIATPLAALLVISLTASFLPINFSPLDLGAFGERVQEAFPFLKQLRGAGIGAAGRFSLRSTGFSPTMGALGGPVRLDHRVAIHVTPDRHLRDTLYLRGATFYTYTGRTWLEPEGEYVPVPDDGTIATGYSSSVLLDYSSVQVSPALGLGSTLFAPLEPMRVEGLRAGYKVDPDGNLWSDRSVARGSAYKVTSRVPRYSAEQIRLLTQPSTTEGLEPYLTVPASMPERVGELARAIAEREATPFDKAVAIENWLRSLPYDLDVPALPAGEDFVDHFLFDLKRGYCVYSASAMAVMLREVGIPSRLVEGFAIPASAQYSEAADGKRTYVGLNSHAHAWVEAYFPGYGWVTFDPTPRADLPLPDRSTPAPTAPSTSSGQTPNSGSNLTDDPTQGDEVGEDFNEDFGGGGAGGGGADEILTRELPLVLYSLVVLLVGLLFFAYRKLQAQARLLAAEGGQVVQEAWAKTSWLMTLFSAGPQPWETPREYARNLGKRWPTLKEPAEQVAEDYTVARYAPAGTPVNPEAPSRARELWNKVHEQLFERFGWRTYFWRRLRGKPGRK